MPYLCDKNVNDLNFVLSPLCMVCMKFSMVSFIKLGFISCVYDKNKDIPNFALSPL